MKGVAAAAMLVAGAAQADPYPLVEADRPQNLAPGMTTLDIGEDFPTYVTTTNDAMGNPVMSTSSLGHYDYFDLAVAHAFGPVQVTAEVVDIDAFLSVALDTGIPGVLALSFHYEHAVNSPNYYGSQAIGYEYKRMITPHRLAFAVGGNVALNELDFISASNDKVVAHQVFGGLGAAAIVQITPRLSIDAGPQISVPLVHSASLDPTTGLAAQLNLQYAFRRSDLYGVFALDDLTHTIHPYAGLGIVIRFGKLAS